MVAVELSEAELELLKNALNEVRNGPEAIEEWEFQTRLGAYRKEADELLTRLKEILRTLRPPR